jgi:ankyrin repeat protein
VKKHTVRYAAKSGNDQTILATLKEIEVDEEGDDGHTRDILLTQALMGAAEGGHVDMVEMLLKSGADPAAEDDCGSTALHWAAWGGHTEIENQRYNNHSDIDDESDVLNRHTLNSPQHEAVISTLTGKGGGALINARNSQGCTPLHWVAGAGSVGMIRFMLQQSADPDIKDVNDRSSLNRAEKTGDETIVQLLQGDTSTPNL